MVPSLMLTWYLLLQRAQGLQLLLRSLHLLLLRLQELLLQLLPLRLRLLDASLDGAAHLLRHLHPQGAATHVTYLLRHLHPTHVTYLLRHLHPTHVTFMKATTKFQYNCSKPTNTLYTVIYYTIEL